MPSQGPLVVVGSSAGGVEALSMLVSTLRKDFPAPLVIAQHLDPTRASSLGSILERRTPLPVTVVSGRTALEGGHVYVVPSNRHVIVEDGCVVVAADQGERPSPSVNLLLSTAARAYGERLVAVILTGSGHDGAAGAVEVKEAGGVVVIQNPATAAYPAMPMALPPTAVDHVAELDAIGPLLHRLVSQTADEEPPPGKQEVMPALLDLLGRQSAIDFQRYKPTTLLRRIGRRMAVARTATMTAYYDYLREHPAEVAELAKALLIKVTEFFRDPDAFKCLREEVLPALLAEARKRGRVLRVWSAGCATGEEAYSLALLLSDALGDELPEWNLKVFATDVSEAAVAFARHGLYPANVLSNVPREALQRHFEKTEHGLRVSKRLRQMVIFGQQDLTRAAPFPRIDLVVCRNLLIYFQPDLQSAVLDTFAYALSRTQGFLFLGKAETARPSRATFELTNKKWKVYRCVRGPVAALGAPAASAAASRAERAEKGASAGPEVPVFDLGQLRRLNEVLLREVPMGIGVVDRQYRIVSINAAARRLFGIREAASDLDFLHAARGLPYGEVRSAIDQCFRDRAPVMLTEVSVASPGESRQLMVQVTLLPPEGLDLDCVLVTALDVTEQAGALRRLQSLQDDQRHLSDELGAANRRLTDTVKELQDTNEELQAANEELMLAQEELQATNEEFEATNEELQATNEELETTNEELHARTSELQEPNRVLAGERLRLSEMVGMAPFHIVVLRGRALTVEAANPSSLALFGGGEAMGRPFEEVCRGPAFEPLLRGAREAFGSDRRWVSGRIATPMEGLSGEPAARELVHTIVPIHDARGAVDGVIIYADDVTEKHAREDQERAEMLRLMIEHAHPVALGLYEAREGRLLQASPRYRELLSRVAGGTDGNLEGTAFRDVTLLASSEDADRALAAVRATGQPIRIPELRRRLPGDEREAVWDWTLIPIAFGEGKPEHAVRAVVVCAFEVTGQVQLREELEKVDQVKDEFLAMASHELRTPLVPLTTYVDVMQNLVDEARATAPSSWVEEVGRLVQRFRKQIADLTRLTDDLLDVGRLQTGTIAIESGRVDLRRVVEEAREQASQIPDAPSIRLSTEQGLFMRGDEGRLVQATFNLLANAVRYASEGGRIELRLQRRGADRARIEVEDHGPGIAPGDEQNIFGRFYRGLAPSRSARSGLGLGLFICKQIAERHGGTVAVDSTPGKGARFRIDLPVDGAGRATQGRPRGRRQEPAPRAGRAPKGPKGPARRSGDRPEPSSRPAQRPVRSPAGTRSSRTASGGRRAPGASPPPGAAGLRWRPRSR